VNLTIWDRQNNPVRDPEPVPMTPAA
jgi:hypothetical protein